jgi:hypothetical protein
MDEDSWDPAMQRYVEILIERARGRPVLQFNRIDFRLPWFRRHFPGAKIVHLYRHPRDQWMSSFPDPKEYPANSPIADFPAHDHYYLLMWAADLKYYFPFLGDADNAHPYRLFYLIWKLSYLFGRRFAHVSLAYEDLLANPDAKLADLYSKLDFRDADLGQLAKLIEKPRSGRWRKYAPENWFQDHESHCEKVLADFFRA